MDSVFDQRQNIDFPKILCTLHELSKDNFSVSDDTILEKLFAYIEDIGIHSLIETLNSPLSDFCGWIECAIKKWNEKELCYQVKTFTVRLIGFIGSCFEGFVALKSRNIVVHLQKLASSAEVKTDSCLMVPLISAFGLFLNHEDGWKWVIDTLVWKYVIQSYYDDRSIYIDRSGVKFTSQLINKSYFYNSDIGADIMYTLCEPLILSNFLKIVKRHDLNHVDCSSNFLGCIETLEYSSETVIHKYKLRRAAKYITDVLEDLLSKNTYIPDEIFLVKQSETNAECLIITDILSCSSPQDHDTFSSLIFMVDLINTMNKVNHLKLEDTLPTVTSEDIISEVETCLWHPVYIHVYKVVKSIIHQGHFENLVNFCVMSLFWRNKLDKQSNSCCSCIDFENIVVFCLCKLLRSYVCCFNEGKERLCTVNSTNWKLSDVDFVEKLWSTDSLEESNESLKLRFHHFQLGVFGLVRCFPFIKHELSRCNLYTDVCMAFDFIVSHFLTNQDTIKPLLLNMLTLISKFAEYLNTNVEKFEDYNIPKTVLTIINQDCCDPRVTISSLQVMGKIINNHIAPCLVSTSNLVSSINQLLARLSVLVTNTIWEIRDSALELFQSVIEFVELTPWPFISSFHSELVNTIIDLAASDESAYVRASALKLLSKTVRAKVFWTIISPELLCDLGLKTLLEDEMPTPRRAACDLVTALYINFVPQIIKDENKIHDTVFMSSITDLDWEVKIATLKYWKCTVDKHLADGMVPVEPAFINFFPKSGSKENAISEIIRIMKKLGRIGCLKAIWMGVNDECDIKVCEESKTIMDYFEELDKKWDFIDRVYNNDDLDDKEDIEEKSCATIPENSDRLSKVLPPKTFFTNLHNQDWRIRLASRRTWIQNTCDGLDSLLDHILSVDNRAVDWDHNAVDCY